MEKSYFCTIPGIGRLITEKILEIYAYDSEPSLFICIDENNALYLCYASMEDFSMIWAINPITYNTVKDLMQGKITIKDAIMSKEKGSLLLFTNLNHYEWEDKDEDFVSEMASVLDRKLYHNPYDLRDIVYINDLGMRVR